MLLECVSTPNSALHFVKAEVAIFLQVKLGVKAVTIDDFFKENLLSNLVQLLGIDPSRVRIVDIVSESSSRRRRKRSSGGVFNVLIEIGDPPPTTNGSISSSNSSSNYTGEKTIICRYWIP